MAISSSTGRCCFFLLFGSFRIIDHLYNRKYHWIYQQFSFIPQTIFQCITDKGFWSTKLISKKVRQYLNILKILLMKLS